MIRITSLPRVALLGMATLALGVLALRVRPMAPSEPTKETSTPTSAPRVAFNLLSASPSIDSARSTAGSSDASAAHAARDLSRRLRLLGTVLEKHPFAFIEDTLHGTSRRYWVNDTVASATVRQIHRGAVRLQTSYGHQVVLLLEPTLTGNAPEGRTESPRASRSPTDVSIQFRPQLNATDGAFEGLIVEALEPAALARRLGVEPGDLIQGVNGQRLLTPAQSLQVLKKAWRQPELALELRRDEQPLVRTLNLGAIQHK